METLDLTVNKLFRLCVEDSLKDQKILPDLISMGVYRACWDALNDCVTKFSEPRKGVTISKLGVVYEIQCSSEKGHVLIPSSAFLLHYGLTYTPGNFKPSPTFETVPLNYEHISGSAKLDKRVFLTVLSVVIKKLGELLGNSPQVIINLETLGMLQGKNRKLSTFPMLKPSRSPGTSTVKTLVSLQPKLLPQMNKSFSGTSLPMKKRKEPQAAEPQQESFSLHLRNLSLLDDPAALFKTKFKVPRKSLSNFPPVLNLISRTLAAPMISGKRDLAPNARIASYYNREARRLVMGHNSMYIVNENPLVTGTPVLSVALQCDDLLRRYLSYIDNEIPEHILPELQQHWVARILRLIQFSSRSLSQHQVNLVIKENLKAVDFQYKRACKKAIFDYVLKDKAQRTRLGFEYNPQPPEEYGERPSNLIEPSEEWRSNSLNARIQLAAKLKIHTNLSLKLDRI